MISTRPGRCRRPCCHGFPYAPFTPRPIARSEPERRVFGVGLFIVLLLLLIGAIASSVDDRGEPACGKAPSNATRSAGWWYSGDVAVAPVDPYNPDCYPKP